MVERDEANWVVIITVVGRMPGVLKIDEGLRDKDEFPESFSAVRSMLDA